MTKTQTPVGFLGRGAMGGGMAKHLLKEGFTVTQNPCQVPSRSSAVQSNIELVPEISTQIIKPRLLIHHLERRHIRLIKSNLVRLGILPHLRLNGALGDDGPPVHDGPGEGDLDRGLTVLLGHLQEDGVVDETGHIRHVLGPGDVAVKGV